MTKTAIIIIIVILVGAVILLWMFNPGQYAPPQPQQPQPQTQTPPPADSTQSINQEVDAVDLGNLDREFETIDKDLQGL